MIPLNTTRISVLRVPGSDGYDEPYAGTSVTGRTVIDQHVRAVIHRPTGTEQVAGGEQAVSEFGLVCDLTDLTYLDLVQDETTGVDYRVVWVMTYPNDHVEAGLRLVQGEV